MRSLPLPAQLEGSASATGPDEASGARSLRVPAAPEHLHAVRTYVDEVAAEFGLEPRARHETVFAVNEAVTNAIKHGRPFRDGTVTLHIEITGDTLIYSVSDQGRFASRELDDALAESGRGLSLMAHFMDAVELSTEAVGTTVRLHKRRPDRPGCQE
jgi:anti-sigma regulatory factor (Ser/Thr protein kinase)